MHVIISHMHIYIYICTDDSITRTRKVIACLHSCLNCVGIPSCSNGVCCLTQTGPYAVLSKDTMPQTYKRKRSWSRAVFSNLQRKGLEKRFEIQKYVTKPDRKQLAAMLGLTDAQVIIHAIHMYNKK